VLTLFELVAPVFRVILTIVCTIDDIWILVHNLVCTILQYFFHFLCIQFGVLINRTAAESATRRVTLDVPPNCRVYLLCTVKTFSIGFIVYRPIPQPDTFLSMGSKLLIGTHMLISLPQLLYAQCLLRLDHGVAPLSHEGGHQSCILR